ncbi:hypothetical protein MRS44_005766 [Fusarium solani]|uniref:uncharacterized protein n=1 Tax=Fusarium solani TaxID=169388 RepID=UPI0032C41794|nr:hypothetical protein MRS44_005766 [Fusarium solani]
MASKSFYALVAGVGPGTGRATALRFAQKYPVVLLARRPESYEGAVADIKKAGGQAVGITADVSDPTSLKNALASIEKELPGSRLAAAVFNVNSGFARKPFLELKAEEIDASLNGSVRAFFHFAQTTLPLLQKGSAQFGSFAAGKWALRGLAQSLAREFHPQGVHVAHAVIDGVIDIPRTKDWQVNDGAEDGKIKPEAIAETYWYLHTQHRSAFTHEVDIRPYVEKF